MSEPRQGGAARESARREFVRVVLAAVAAGRRPGSWEAEHAEALLRSLAT